MYSRKAIQSVIDTGKYYGIRVIPEFDTPGDTNIFYIYLISYHINQLYLEDII